MYDIELARAWGAQSALPALMRRWHWCRSAHERLLTHSAHAAGVPASCVAVRRPALAEAFWSWSAVLDNTRGLERCEALDLAHFASGALLWRWLVDRPLTVREGAFEDTVRPLTVAGLTMLQAWRQAVGAPLLGPELDTRLHKNWNSYVENVREEPQLAIAFMDLFSGRPPDWRTPTQPEFVRFS